MSRENRLERNFRLMMTHLLALQPTTHHQRSIIHAALSAARVIKREESEQTRHARAHAYDLGSDGSATTTTTAAATATAALAAQATEFLDGRRKMHTKKWEAGVIA